MRTKKVGIAYLPVLLSLTFEGDPLDDTKMAAKEIMLSVFEELQGMQYEVGNATFEFYTLDWLPGSYMDQVQEFEVEDDVDDETSEETEESS